MPAAADGLKPLCFPGPKPPSSAQLQRAEIEGSRKELYDAVDAELKREQEEAYRRAWNHARADRDLPSARGEARAALLALYAPLCPL